MIADVALDRRRRRRQDPGRAGRRPSPIADAIADTIAKVGENMTLRRAAGLSVGKGVIGKLRAQFRRATGSAGSA